MSPTPGGRRVSLLGHSTWHRAGPRHISMDSGSKQRALGWSWGTQGYGSPRSPAGPVSQARRRSQGLRQLLSSFPAAKSRGQQQAHGPRADRRASRRGELAGTGRKKSIVCRNPTKGPGPQCRGFFREKQTCLSFHQLLLKQPIGFDSLLFHPKQMINK